MILSQRSLETILLFGGLVLTAVAMGMILVGFGIITNPNPEPTAGQIETNATPESEYHMAENSAHHPGDRR